MDDIISAALEEVCVRGASGLHLPDLWASLQAAVSSNGLQLSDSVKKVIWARLVSHPRLRFVALGSTLEQEEVLLQSLTELERVGINIVAEEHLRDSFLGLYDLKQAPHFEFSQTQKRVLERLAMTRNNGITQSELAKEFDMKGNNFFYVVRSLESHHLIVRQSTIVREKESLYMESAQKGDHIVNTNLLHLYRYAKNMNLNPQQRLEITRSACPYMLDIPGDAKACAVPVEDIDGRSEEDVRVNDFLPAMRAICEKLEASNDKVDFVTSIKQALGYRMATGHRAWRNILFRLKHAGLVTEFQSKVNGKDATCLRLLKKFDRKYFLPNTIMSKCNDHDADHLIKSGKRGQITDQLVELPLDHCIYDMIDAEGQKGITILELSKRLGISSKKLHKRVISMRDRFGLVSETEVENKIQVYRFWTPRMYQQDGNDLYSDNCKLLLDGNAETTQSSDLARYDSLNISSKDDLKVNSMDELLLGDETCNGQRSETLIYRCEPISIEAECEQEPKEPTYYAKGTGGDIIFDKSNSTESRVVPSLLPNSVSSVSLISPQRYACRSSTAFAEKRKRRIAEKLEIEKFLLKVELHKWLEDIEKDKPTIMDSKTLDRSLKTLQVEGTCKCIRVYMPSLTNFNSLRHTEAVLHSSVIPSEELLRQIYERQRYFDIQCRRLSFSEGSKADHPVAKLRDSPVAKEREVRKRSTHVADMQVSNTMSVNGFVMAKMVRAKLLHKFLWNYFTSLPFWQNSLHSSRNSVDCKLQSAGNCQLFSLDAAIKEMPLELFLQVAGSKAVINNLEQKCKLRLKLSDLPVQERKCLMDTRATCRLSSIVEILRRLRLIQLVNRGVVQDSHLLTHELEFQPYIEEPLPAVLPSSDVGRTDILSKLRHDFVLLNKEALDYYWEFLEYSFSASDPTASKQCFPGSAVEEVFHRRSWSSVRVMSMEQRMELLKRVSHGDQRKKIPFTECVKIAGELNLTLEQVLRVSYDKRQAHLNECCYMKSRRWDNCENTNIGGSAFSKRMRLTDTLHDHSQSSTQTGELYGSTRSALCDGNKQSIVTGSDSVPMGEDDSIDQTCIAKSQNDARLEPQPHISDAETATFISQCAFHELKPSRKRKFLWTDNLDRQLVMQYARHRAMLGVRFFRVDWSSLHDLPAQPVTCKRRMATLNRKSDIRRAVLRLCSLLGERYFSYIDKSAIKEKRWVGIFDSKQSDKGVMLVEDAAQNESTSCETICQSNSRQYCWDDFEDPNIKMALDDVLKYKRLAKMEDATRSGSRPERWTSNLSADASYFTSNEVEQIDISSNVEEVFHSDDKKGPNSAAVPSKTAQSRFKSHGKLLELRGKGSISKICKSVAVGNAIELLKLVFLNCSKSPGAQASLSTTLQKYSEGEIFSAFSYLRMKNYLVPGHGSRPFVLSRKFFQNISSSPFPNDSAKRAANFSSFLHHHHEDIMQDGLSIASDLQCGEIFHLFSLVLSGEVFISPCLPENGIGEADELRSLESFLSPGDLGNIGVSKISKRKVDATYSWGKVKKQKSQVNIDGDRREKGFPGIKVIVNMEKISGDDALEYGGDDKAQSMLAMSISGIEPSNLKSSSENLDAPLQIVSQIKSAVCPDESCWDALAMYMTLLSSAPSVENEPKLSPAVFSSVYSIICQVGEQGISMDELSRSVNINGEQVAAVIEALEAFQLAVKVDAFDSVWVVDASYASRYFINVLAQQDFQNQGYLSQNFTRSQDIISGVSKTNFPVQDKSNDCSRLGNSKPKNNEDVQDFEICDAANCGLGISKLSRPILPWINGDGSTNSSVYKALTRQILGIVMQNPGVMEEDIIRKIDVLNPQSCRRLLEVMILDSHIRVRRMCQTAAPPSPPAILQHLFPSNLMRPTLKLQNHYFANPMSTTML